MFTGLVSSLGTVTRVDRSADGARIEIAADAAAELEHGDSVAVNGVCLTATDVNGGSFAAEVVNETLLRSSLAVARPGDEVNLELPLRAGDRLGGHVVQGHVDGTGTVRSVSEDGFSRRMEIAASAEILRYLVRKGSVAVHGVSLTVAELGEQSFTVALIPETLEHTTLGRAAIGTSVNLEVDILAKYVERLAGVSG
ncbi:MAG: riboflavin synthase [Actinomycetota bacterium]|nr:riboflavin synthase [Actinomycetota bacterium]